ncbi:2-octaprenyl-6-methoxyphenyl hydroxylase [Leucothrix pacifica]|uniref:2-octaprenyl-6-methoxyphenyl hydroxylase n=1 Tax=Leucothrix pacifica TaxID=1247513 RepID=A0A317CN73_9GAMM|nr:2-octaprenyl-6-methoxyphenyl hydroxylase [Leucothrix pacifica]PWR00086.1 2-octaprenyl-6-methoxyphenyl hydroxylase [Leucothrix pacifica]
MQTAFDVLIVGGGMVGASLAVALKDLPIKVGVIEAYPFEALQQPAYDDRAIALSYGAGQILRGMGVWSSIEAVATPIDSIHVSDRGHFGATRLSAKQQKVPALGYLIQSRDYGSVLQRELVHSDVTLFQPAQVCSIEDADDTLTVSISQNADTDVVSEARLSTKLLIACDGANSKVRDMVGIEAKQHDYQQVAVVANVTTQKPHNNQAFERFTEQGPIALLPMSENRSSLVWTLGVEHYEAVLALDDAGFLKALGEAFGYRLGRFVKAGKRSFFPLKLTSVEQFTTHRVAVIGNAAHALHPVAGQGLNLALRDIADLASQIAESMLGDDDLGSAKLLDAYATHRKNDTNRTIRYTDSLVKIFSNDQFLLGHARAVGLMMVDRLPPLRRLLAKQSMGMTHRQSRLSRGLPLLEKQL